MILIVGGSYQGKTKYARENFGGYKFFNQSHLFIKKRLKEGRNKSEILDEILDATSNGDWVVIADEIGGGIVPLDPFERKWQEISGAIFVELASKADEVHRVILGMGQRIK